MEIAHVTIEINKKSGFSPGSIYSFPGPLKRRDEQQKWPTSEFKSQSLKVYIESNYNMEFIIKKKITGINVI